MDELLAAAAAAVNAPEAMVMRSARARAAADGASVEDVLGVWAGGGTIAPSPGGGGSTGSTTPGAAAPTAAVAPVAPAAPSGPPMEVLAAEPPAGLGEEPPDEPADDGDEDETGADLVAGGTLPRWLVALFVVVPVFAIAYALFLPNGPRCGDAGRLAVDPVSGLAVNCDGSDYGAEVVDFYTMGESTFTACAACHGANGGGGGNFPAFTGGSLLTTFPEGQCSDHVEWVRLGTAGWPEPTYGAPGKPVGGSGAAMPAFGTVLSEQELRSVVLYERVTFGNESLEAAIADCGLSADASGG